MIVQISAGQGPSECQMAVAKLFAALKKEYEDLDGGLYDCSVLHHFFAIRISTASDIGYQPVRHDHCVELHRRADFQYAGAGGNDQNE